MRFCIEYFPLSFFFCMHRQLYSLAQAHRLSVRLKSTCYVLESFANHYSPYSFFLVISLFEFILLLVSVLSRTSSGRKKKKEAAQFDPHETVAHKRKKTRYIYIKERKKKKNERVGCYYSSWAFSYDDESDVSAPPLPCMAGTYQLLFTPSRKKRKLTLFFFPLLFIGLSAGGITRKRRTVIAIQKKTTAADKRERKKKKEKEWKKALLKR